MSQKAIDRVAERLRPVQALFRNGRFVGRVSCASCPAQGEWSAASMPAPDVVKKKLEARGWTIGRVATCADCARPVKGPGMPAATAETSRPSDNAKVAERLLIRVMEDEAYDEQAKRYKPGYSDARMATDTGLAEKHVAAVRERLFGPPGEPDEVAELRTSIAALTSELGKLRSRFDLMCSKNGFKQS